jgi:uncharacterized protein involved in exopolysaccharide biosynthesis/Mrp family chromosome partitioning ATPase
VLERLRDDLDIRGSNPSISHDDGFTVDDIRDFIRRYWHLVTATTLLSLLLGTAYVLTAPRIYTATAQILIDMSQPENITHAISESSVAMDTPQVESQIALLLSEQIAKKVAGLLEKHRETTPMHAPIVNQSEIPSPNNPPTEEGKTSPSTQTNVSLLHRLLFGSPEKESQSQEHATLAAATQEIQNSMDVRRVGLSYVLELSFKAKDPDTAAFVANSIGDTYVQDKLDLRMQGARQGGLWLEMRIEELRHLMNEAALDVQQFKAKRDYRIIDRSQKQQSEDNKREGPLGIAPMSNGVAGESPAANPQSDTDAKTTDVPPEQTTLEELESRALTYQKIYESYLQVYTEIVQRQSYPGTNARVITRAVPPTQKSSPRVKLTLVGAGALGTLLGFGFALTHMSFDQTVRSSRQIWRNLRVPLLGQAIQSHDGFSSTLRRTLRSDKRKHPNRSLVIVEDQPFSHTARGLRALGLAFKQMVDEQGTRVIGLLGTVPGLNSTAVSSNLALLNARAGKRTLLVETDMARPNLMTEFAPQSPCGLQDVLDGDIDLANAVIASKQEPMLSLLMPRSTGTSPSWTTDHIRKLHVIINQIRDQYDLILVHLPPVNGANSTSMAVDGVVIVSKAGTTVIQDLVDVATGLQMAGKPLLGVIISDLA